MACSVHIGNEFRSVPSEIRKSLRAKLRDICAVIDTLGYGSPILESLANSCLAVAVAGWRFQYELDDDHRLVVIQAVPPR